MDDQAQARAHRIGQQKQVRCSDVLLVLMRLIVRWLPWEPRVVCVDVAFVDKSVL